MVKKQNKPRSKKALTMRVIKKYKRCRVTELSLGHGPVRTPVYMPVGTKATIKSLVTDEMEALGCQIMLCNTYHLALYPGGDFLGRIGGVHKFMNWKRNLLTDSGGYQMVSLSKLIKVTEEGVEFSSPYDGSLLFISPEKSIGLQNQIGSDIMMALDDVVKTTTQGPRMKEAMERTIRWIDRNISGNARPQQQALFPIIQGGIDTDMRKTCLDALVSKDALGYAIGGLSGGEAKDVFWRIVSQCTRGIPQGKPIYCMGVGYPEDMLVCAALGVDMFDCTFPCRTARFGTALTRFGSIRLKNSQYQLDFSPLQPGCKCDTCLIYSRAYLHSLVQKEEVFCSLVTTHNLYFELNLMRNFGSAVQSGTLEKFLKEFMTGYFAGAVPEWIKNALGEGAQLDIQWDK